MLLDPNTMREKQHAYINRNGGIWREGSEPQSWLSSLHSSKRHLRAMCLSGRAMGLHTRRFLIVLVCIGFLAVQLEVVCGLRNIDHVLRWDGEHGIYAKKPRILNDVNVAHLDAQKRSVSAPSSFDPNRASKRRVRRGSDPIHNRC